MSMTRFSGSPLPEPIEPVSEINVHDLLGILRRRRSLAIQVFCLVLGAGIIWSALMKPVYQTIAKVQVATGSGPTGSGDATNPLGAMLAAAQPDSLSTQVQEMMIPSFLGRAYGAAQVGRKPGVVPPSIHVEPVPDANIIAVSV